MKETFEIVNTVIDFNVHGTNVVTWYRHEITRDDGTIAVSELTSTSFLEACLYKRAIVAGRKEWSNSDLIAELSFRFNSRVTMISPEPPELPKELE